MTGRDEDSTTSPSQDEDATATVCPLCAVGCRLAADADQSRVTGMEGPANQEGRLCRKGIHALDSIPDENRIKTPLVRRDGSLEPATWSAAFGRIIDGIERTIDRAGPDGLAFLGAPHSTNEENYLLEKLARMLGTNNVDNRARLCHVSMARALEERVGWPATTNGLADLRATDVILVVGANPAERQPVAFNSFVRPAVTDGTTLVHVDPVGNGTTRLADEHLAPRPGTDALVLNLLCAAVLDSDGHDESFVANRTREFDRFADELATIDRQSIADAAGVDLAAIERVADRLGAGDGVAAIVGTGIEGGDSTAADALLNLLLLTGDVGRPGAGLHLFRGLANEQGATDAGCVPDRLPGHQPVTDAAARERVADVWGVEPPASPGDTARDLLAGFGDDIHAALVVGENPAVSKRDPDWVDDRLRGLDTLAVAELRHNETTRLADVVLPAAAGLEKRGTVTNLDRLVQPLSPVVEPPDGVRADFDILRTLGRRLLGEGFAGADPVAVFEEWTTVAPTHEEMTYPDDAATARWPSTDGRVLYREAFETDDGRAPFVLPGLTADRPSDAGLTLVVGGRATDTEHTAPSERRVRLHPDDAADRDVEDGDPVRVGADGVSVEGLAVVADSVRQGAVFCHATMADPLVRNDSGTVTVQRVYRSGERVSTRDRSCSRFGAER